jgi:hypothetical protein
MTSALVLAVECFDDAKPVVGVDLQKLDHHEADRSTFAGGARAHLAPEFGIDALDYVVHEAARLHRSARNLSVRTVGRSTFDHQSIICGSPMGDPVGLS